MRKWALPLIVLIAGFAALRSAGDIAFWRMYVAAATDAGAAQRAALVRPRIRIPGAHAELPRAPADQEFLAPEALVAATAQARTARVQALVVHRHGHRVFEYFAAGVTGHDALSGGELSPALFALATGARVDGGRVSHADAVRDVRSALSPAAAAGWRNPWSVATRRRLSLAAPPAFLLEDMDGTLAQTLSRRVWLPLQAGDAWLWGRDDTALRVDCCVVARLDDWVRVGDLFLGQGSYQGERIVSADWMRQLLAADAHGQVHPVWMTAQRPWTGAEPPAARDVYWFDLESDVRIWIVPRRGVVVLQWSRGDEASDTTLLNIILRGLTDQSPSIGGAAELNDIVPGH